MKQKWKDDVEYIGSDFPIICGHTFYAPLLVEESIVIDLGACSGTFSTAIASLFGCKCFAVEATTQNFEGIEETHLIKKFHYAISKENKEIEICIADDDYHWGSIDKLGGFNYSTSEYVAGRTLETLIDQIGAPKLDLVKVDIEGAEVDMFSTTSDKKIRSIAQFTVEFHDFVDPASSSRILALKERMLDLGFYVFTFTNRFHGDVLFINKESIKFSTVERANIFFNSKLSRGIQRIVNRHLPLKVH